MVNAEQQNTAMMGEAMEDFYRRFKDDANVMDSWLSLQAASPVHGTLESVKALMQHGAYDATSPNKLRSVVGGFASNMNQFHVEGGAGYEFLADILIEMDRKNPQIASRLATPLTRWRKFEPVSSALMKKALERVKSTPDLSSDVYEVVTKSLT